MEKLCSSNQDDWERLRSKGERSARSKDDAPEPGDLIWWRPPIYSRDFLH